MDGTGWDGTMGRKTGDSDGKVKNSMGKIAHLPPASSVTWKARQGKDKGERAPSLPPVLGAAGAGAGAG